MRRADNLATFMCRLSLNLGASTSWNPQGLSRPVMGLLCFTFYTYFPCMSSISPVSSEIHPLDVEDSHCYKQCFECMLILHSLLSGLTVI